MKERAVYVAIIDNPHGVLERRFLRHGRRIVCDMCVELDKLVGHLRVIKQFADVGTRDAATKMIDEKEAEKAMLHRMLRTDRTLDQAHRQR